MTEQTYFDEFEIQHIKFTSGDEVISIVSGREGDHLLLEHPMKINVMSNGENEVYFFTEYMPLAETDITYVNEKNVVAYTLVTDDVKEKYVRACLRSKYQEEIKNDPEPTITDTELDNMPSPSDQIH